jgi:phosphotransferase system  glucose/maltose/N-acetylglucosamine-specific IIC component
MGNCVGLRTHKFFLCYLFWTVVACLHVGISSTFIIGVNADAIAKIGKMELSGLMAECLAYGVTFAVFIMFCIHHNLIAKNESTLEMGGVGPFKNNNPYDLGEW